MIINDIREKSKHAAYVVVGAGLLILGVFGVIKLVYIEAANVPVILEYTESQQATAVGALKTLPETTLPKAIKNTSAKFAPVPLSPNDGQSGMMYEGSRGGTTYYPVGCAAAKRISAKNKIWFESTEEAERLGYNLSKLCAGSKTNKTKSKQTKN